MQRYLQPQPQKADKQHATEKAVANAMVRAAMSGTADKVILPMQDVLQLGAEARINTPSTTSGNWVWRMEKGAATRALAAELRTLAQTYGR